MGGAFAALVLIVAPMTVASYVVALLPLRRPRVRAAVLGAHVLVTSGLIAFLDGPRALWVITLGGGVAIAGWRLAALAVEWMRTGVRRRR
jgi:hypothetical protein